MTQSLSNVFNGKFASNVVEIVEPHLCQQTSQGPKSAKHPSESRALKTVKCRLNKTFELLDVSIMYISHMPYAWTSGQTNQIRDRFRQTDKVHQDHWSKRKLKCLQFLQSVSGLPRPRGTTPQCHTSFLGQTKRSGGHGTNTPSGHISMAEP